jgi:hypothetical protein
LVAEIQPGQVRGGPVLCRSARTHTAVSAHATKALVAIVRRSG